MMAPQGLLVAERVGFVSADAGAVRTGTPSKARLHWMDMLRGSAIVLVMIWHSSAIPVLYGASMPAPVRAVNMFFLPFRMPTLMFLSGLLLPASLRKPLPVYYAGKFAAIGWPYLIFVLLDRLLQGNDNPGGTGGPITRPAICGSCSSSASTTCSHPSSVGCLPGRRSSRRR